MSYILCNLFKVSLELAFPYFQFVHLFFKKIMKNNCSCSETFSLNSKLYFPTSRKSFSTVFKSRVKHRIQCSAPISWERVRERKKEKKKLLALKYLTFKRVEVFTTFHMLSYRNFCLTVFLNCNNAFHRERKMFKNTACMWYFRELFTFISQELIKTDSYCVNFRGRCTKHLHAVNC